MKLSTPQIWDFEKQVSSTAGVAINEKLYQVQTNQRVKVLFAFVYIVKTTGTRCILSVRKDNVNRGIGASTSIPQSYLIDYICDDTSDVISWPNNEIQSVSVNVLGAGAEVILKEGNIIQLQQAATGGETIDALVWLQLMVWDEVK